MKIVESFARTSEHYPCFLLPVAVENGSFYFQIIDEAEKVTGFSEISLKEIKLVAASGVTCREIQIKQDALFAFLKDEHAVPFLGTKNQLIDYLKDYSKEFVGIDGQFSNEMLDVEKQFEIASFIGDVNLLYTILVAAIESEVPLIEYWAYHEFFQLHQNYKKERQRKCQNTFTCLSDRKNQNLLDSINRLIQGEIVCSKSYQVQEKYVLSVLSSLNNYVGRKRKLNEVFEKCVDISDVFAREVALENGDVFLLSRDMNSTENVEETLDVMAKNMADGTEYQYLINGTCSAKQRNAIISTLKAKVLIRDPKILTRKQMKFYDLSLMKDKDSLLSAFENFLYLKNDTKMEFYVLVPDMPERVGGCAFLKLTSEVAKECWDRLDETRKDDLRKCLILLPVAS